MRWTICGISLLPSSTSRRAALSSPRAAAEGADTAACIASQAQSIFSEAGAKAGELFDLGLKKARESMANFARCRMGFHYFR